MKAGTFNSGGWRGFSIDVEDGPFKDVNVRRAIAYSLDKAAITEGLTSSRGQVLEGLPPLLFIRGASPEEGDRRGAEEGADVPVQPRQGDGGAREVRLSRGASARR